MRMSVYARFDCVRNKLIEATHRSQGGIALSLDVMSTTSAAAAVILSQTFPPNRCRNIPALVHSQREREIDGVNLSTVD